MLPSATSIITWAAVRSIYKHEQPVLAQVSASSGAKRRSFLLLFTFEYHTDNSADITAHAEDSLGIIVLPKFETSFKSLVPAGVPSGRQANSK